jgi:hypothetical protein
VRVTAFQILRLATCAVPLVAGLDELGPQLLTDWTIYAAPALVQHAPVSVDLMMRMAGATEIGLALWVLAWPATGGYALAVWLCAITADLLLARGFYDVALRDAALALVAVGFARLAAVERHEARAIPTEPQEATS